MDRAQVSEPVDPLAGFYRGSKRGPQGVHRRGGRGRGYLDQDGLAGVEARVAAVGGVGDVEAAEDFDGGVLGEDGIVDAVLGHRTAQVGRQVAAPPPPPPQVVVLEVAHRRLFQKATDQPNETSMTLTVGELVEWCGKRTTWWQPPFCRQSRTLHW